MTLLMHIVVRCEDKAGMAGKPGVSRAGMQYKLEGFKGKC